jgi:hypothetical protein
MTRRLAFALLASALSLSSARAADLPEGAGRAVFPARAVVHASACPLWQPPYGIRIVPTNDVCDPTYVGSSMGLSRPSYYGNLPPPGYNAP